MQILEFDTFTNVASGQALSVGNPQPYLHQANPDNSDLRQHWLRTSVATNHRPGVAQGLILSRTFSNAIDIVGAVFKDGRSLQQYPVNANPNQLWNDHRIDPQNAARIFECTDPNSPDPNNPRLFAIDVPDGVANTDPQLWHSHHGPNQQWTPGIGLIRFVVFKIQSVASGKVLDVPAGDQAPGVNIQQYGDGGQMCFNQCWIVLGEAGEIDDVGNL